MKRKIIQHSPTSLVVTLPSQWTKRYNIRKGEEINLIQNHEELVIRKDEIKKEPREANINISNLDQTTILHVIRNLYRAGYDKINIKFDNETASYQKENEEVLVTQIIHQELRRLIGYEITREKKNSCIIENISEGISEEIPTIIRRIYLLLIDIAETLYESAKTNNKSGFRIIKEKHETIIRFINYCLRSSKKIRRDENIISDEQYYMLATLDRVVHLLGAVAKRLAILKRRPRKIVVELLEGTVESLKIFHKFMYIKKSSLIKDLNSIRYDMEDKIRESSTKLEGEQDVAVFHLRNILHLLLDICDVRGL